MKPGLMTKIKFLLTWVWGVVYGLSIWALLISANWKEEDFNVIIIFPFMIVVASTALVIGNIFKDVIDYWEED